MTARERYRIRGDRRGVGGTGRAIGPNHWPYMTLTTSIRARCGHPKRLGHSDPSARQAVSSEAVDASPNHLLSFDRVVPGGGVKQRVRYRRKDEVSERRAVQLAVAQLARELEARRLAAAGVRSLVDARGRRPGQE
jgi:hypothetical protein